MDYENEQLNTEWSIISALAETIRIATKGDKRSTYEQVLKLSKELYPELFNIDNSLLIQEQESNLAKEYRQRAKAETTISNKNVFPIDLVMKEIEKLNQYIEISIKRNKGKEADKLVKKLRVFEKLAIEVDEQSNTENDILLRDIYDVSRDSLLLNLGGKKFRDFKISDKQVLRIRLLHPDKPEHITGADIIYEHHNLKNHTIRLASIQYKLWEKKQLAYDDRMQRQLDKLNDLFCQKICDCSNQNHEYRFPTCSAFLRPTDKIQKANQKLLSTGEHIPICKIDSLWEEGRIYNGIYPRKLTYDGIKKVSVSGKTFEQLFKEGKIGSKEFDAYEIKKFYNDNHIFDSKEKVIIHAQELDLNE